MQHRTAIQSSFNIGERPAQGEMFAEFRDFDGHKEPLTKPVSKPKPGGLFDCMNAEDFNATRRAWGLVQDD